MLRFAIIGTGFMGEKHAECLSAVDGARLTAVVSIDTEGGRALAERFGVRFYENYDLMLEDDAADVVDICLPTYLHEDAVIKAAKHGKHVFCEKPVALSAESYARMTEAVEKAGVRFAVGQVVRFWPENELIREKYLNGDFGRVKSVYAARLATHPSWSEWFKDPDKSGGGLFDMHIHDTDYIIHTFGGVERVYAEGYRSPGGCWNHILSTLSFKNGISAVVESSIEMPRSFPMAISLRVNGDRQALEYVLRAGENLEDVDSAVRRTVVYEDGGPPKELEAGDGDPYLEELRYFTESVEAGSPMDRLSPQSIADVLDVITAMKKSLESGEAVRL